MERKLVSIQRIRRIDPIKNADLIECITINGWELIAKKGEFKEDDLAVYFEIDSFLPIEERYAFLKDVKTHQGKQGYRIRTIKMRGQISQGLALPLTMFPEIENSIEGNEVTELLNVFKYDNSIFTTSSDIQQNSNKSFPSFLRKSDQERIQNLVGWFDRYKDEVWEETLKLDGSSMTCYKIKKEPTIFDKIKKFFNLKTKEYRFGVCSRNIELDKEDGGNFWNTAIKYKIEKKIPVGYALQGELIGPSIQSNHEKVDDLEYHIFDIYDIKNQKYLTPFERHSFMQAYLENCIHVPLIGYVKIFEVCQDVKSLLERVKGESMNHGTISEGRVYKSLDGTKSFKCINNDYLIKFEE